MAECYVCLQDDPPLIKPCKCTSMVHPACLVKAINNVKAHKTTCPVCKEQYTIQTVRKRTCVLAPHWKLHLTAQIVSLSTLWGGLYVHMRRSAYVVSWFWEAVLWMLSAVNICACIWFMFLYYMKTGFLCFVKSRVVVHTILCDDDTGQIMV